MERLSFTVLVQIYGSNLPYNNSTIIQTNISMIMLKKFTLLLMVLSTCIFLKANHLSPTLQLTARMNGSNEVPSVNTDAEGVGVFTLNNQKNILNIDISVNGLSGPITGIHFHEGAPGENGGVVFNLSPFVNANRIKGVLRNLSSEEVAKFLSGAYYLNVHTADNPGGEIRGQVLLESDFRYTASLNGDQEVPAVTTDAYGLGVFNLSKSGYKLQVKVVVSGLSGAITASHFHNAALGVNGGVVQDLSSFINGNVITATVDPTAYLDELIAGNIYINVHTAANPGGEIRGQLLLDNKLYFDAFLDGSQENPAVSTTAEGVASVSVSNDLSTLEYHIVTEGLSGPITGAHFHSAPAGENGGVAINLTENIDGNRIDGEVPINVDLLNDLLLGGLYLNVHTAANPGGEIRGQVYKLAREAYSYEFSGGQEVPPTSSMGTGAGMVTIDRDQTNAHFMMVISGLGTDLSAAHFHNARPGSNGGVIFALTDFFTVQGGAYGYWTENNDTPFDHSDLFRSNEVYVNAHTADFPGGEIRANIVRGQNFFANLPRNPGFSGEVLIAAKMTGDQEVPPVSTDAIGVTTLMLNESRDEIILNVSVNGLSGPITGAHIHEGAAGENGDVIFNLTNFVAGNRIKATLTDFTSEQLTKFLSNAYYLNVHTANNPGGEIRAQLTLEKDLTYRANLDGSQEVPAVTTDAIGLATFNYTNVVNALEINVLVSGLSGPITASHLHNAAVGENGGVVEDLSSFIKGNQIRGVVFPGDYLEALQAGEIYINVHTADNPGGEIRGQLNIDDNLTFDTWLSGAQETPPVVSVAQGFAAVSLAPDFSNLSVRVISEGLSGDISASHFHEAALGTAGGVVLNISSGINGNEISMDANAGMISDEIITALLKGNLYINIHTAGFPGGELRGQVYRLLRDGYAYDLCPEQEPGMIDAPLATGGGMTSIDRWSNNANLMVVVSGLTGDITGAHIHGAPVGENGGVIIPLTDSFENGGAFTYLTEVFTPPIADSIKVGNTYVNVHTAAHPGGEIRGQIIRDLTCLLPVSTSEEDSVFKAIHLSPNPANQELTVQFSAEEYRPATITILDQTGKILFSRMIEINEQENQIRLDLSHLLPGFYILNISDGISIVAKKFIRN